MMNSVGPLGFVTSLQDFPAPTELFGARAVTQTEINGSLYLFVASQFDFGVQVLKLENGTLQTVASIENSQTVGLDGPTDLEVVTVGTTKYLVVASTGGSSLASFEIEQDNTGTDGTLTHVQSIFDGNLEGPLLSGVVQIDRVSIGSAQFIVAAARNDNALSVYRVNANGTMTLTDTVTDSEGATLNLDTAYALTSGQIGARTFVFTAALNTDNGISVFEMSANGTLTSVQNLDIAGNNIFRTMTFVTTVAGSFLVTVNDNSGYEIFVHRVGADGTLTQVSSYSTFSSGNDPRFTGIYDVEAFTVDGTTFLLASANNQDAVVVYSLNDDGSITYVNSLTRTEFGGAYGMTTFTRDGKHFIALTGQDTSRLNIIEIGGSADPIVATAGNDRLVGLDGDDDLIALAGNDSLYGGRGDDVLSGRIGNDFLDGGAHNDVLIGGAGNDTLRGGSGADVLIGNHGIDRLSHAASFGGVTVNLLTGAASGGDASGDVFFGIEGLIGSSRNDTLTGNAAANALDGADGNDLLSGLGGNDLLYGGRGNDRLLGGDAADRLYGDSGNDVVNGESGNDLVRGGGGNDTVLGGSGNDQIFGDFGNDQLVGDTGDDTLDGGAGADVFVFAPGFGSDQVNGFSIAEDRLDLSALPAINSLAEFLAASTSFGGNTVLNLQDGSSIFLIGVVETQFTATNLIF